MARIPIARKIDKRKGAIAALIGLLLLGVYAALISFQIADPPPQPVLVEVETNIPEIILKNLRVEGGSSSSGSPSDAEVKPPEPKTEQVITKEESDTEVPTGQANTTNTANSDATSSTTEQSNDPFSSGGSGNGDEGGSGDTFGEAGEEGTEDPGPGGGGKGRTRLNDPNINGVKSNVNATIYLKVTVDAQGNVIAAQNIKARTTTTNQILINRVIYEVKKQTKYNKDPGAPLAKAYMTIEVKAQ
ncbi:MAG: hypothetical protein COA33_003855 [Fluviicola sp.]|nr:hypothetical protein [Fluviicola sp.]